MNAFDISLDNFHIETMPLTEFNEYVHDKKDFVNEVLKTRFEKGAELFICDWKIIENIVYFTLRWK